MTILSAVYRLWAAIRHDQLAQHWQPLWAPHGAYGLKGRPAADSLVFDTCAFLAQATHSGLVVGGLSYDFEKCFDRVPVSLAVHILRARGCDNKICAVLDGFYAQHVKHFRIQGHYDSPFYPSNGLVQGCPLSMLVLSSLTAAWLEHLQEHEPEVEAKSYADDLSLCATAARPRVLQAKVAAVHSHTHQFVTRSGLKLNCVKSFSFGHQSLRGCIPSLPNHKRSFRLTGGTVKLDAKPCWTQLEKLKAAKWSSNVASIRRMPVGWFTKVKWLQRVSPQLIWAQGTRSLASTRDVARTLRAQVVRALLDVDHYSASPHVVFALLAPPSLEPECAMNMAALPLFKRSVQCPSHAQTAAEQLAAPQPFDGPYARAQQLRASPVSGPIVQALVQNRPLPPDWQHALRERWSEQCWQLVLRDRSQDYAGIGRGANRSLTVSLIQQWTKEADELQYMIDMGFTTEPDSTLDPRPRIKILRLLLMGGLMDPERDRRHRREPRGVKCQCGGVPSHDHISWSCPRFRAPPPKQDACVL